MSDSQRLVLALGITEFNGAVEHLRATGQGGPGLVESLEARLLQLILLWAPGANVETTLVEARQYLTENIEALDALLARSAEEVRA